MFIDRQNTNGHCKDLITYPQKSIWKSVRFSRARLVPTSQGRKAGAAPASPPAVGRAPAPRPGRRRRAGIVGVWAHATVPGYRARRRLGRAGVAALTALSGVGRASPNMSLRRHSKRTLGPCRWEGSCSCSGRGQCWLPGQALGAEQAGGPGLRGGTPAAGLPRSPRRAAGVFQCAGKARRRRVLCGAGPGAARAHSEPSLSHNGLEAGLAKLPVARVRVDVRVDRRLARNSRRPLAGCGF